MSLKPTGKITATRIRKILTSAKFNPKGSLFCDMNIDERFFPVRVLEELSKEVPDYILCIQLLTILIARLELEEEEQ